MAKTLSPAFVFVVLLAVSVPPGAVRATDSQADGYTFTLIDVRCDAGANACPVGLAPGGVASQTSVRGINARGDMVGFYTDGAGRQRGFLLKEGVYETIDFPLAGVRATLANGINARGEVVGQYLLPVNQAVPQDSPLYCPANLSSGSNPACIKGFHYWRGIYTTVMFPGHPGAIAQRITSDGDIYGCLHGQDLGMSMFGAVWRRSIAGGNVEIGAIASLTDDGGQLSDAMGVPMSMNNGGTPGGGKTVTGFFMDMNNQQHGYLVRDGQMQSFDPTADTNLTAIWDMSPQELLAGVYRRVGDAAAKRRGFVQSADGSGLVTLELPVTNAFGNTVPALATTVFGINPSGVVVGQYVAAAGSPPRGFVAFPSGGQ